MNIPQHVIEIPTLLRRQRRAHAEMHPFYSRIGSAANLAQVTRVPGPSGNTEIPIKALREARNVLTPSKKLPSFWELLFWLVLVGVGSAVYSMVKG